MSSTEQVDAASAVLADVARIRRHPSYDDWMAEVLDEVEELAREELAEGGEQ